MRDDFIRRLGELAARDPRITLITGDLGFSVFDEFVERFPRQFLNAGVAEQNMLGMATGMAMEGRIVFAYSIANFCTLRCLEQIRNDACYHDANVKVVSVGGGFSYGPLGISHHATEDLAIMRSLPGMTVVSPCTPWEAIEATTAIARHPGTCYLRLDKSTPADPLEGGRPFELGKARLLQDGSDCFFIVTGGILEEVQDAAAQLGKRGVSCGILSMHTLKPLDADAVLRAASKCRVLVTVEEHTVTAGLGSAVAEVLVDHGVYPGRVLRIGLEAGFSSMVGSQKYLRQQYRLDAASIAARALSALNR